MIGRRPIQLIVRFAGPLFCAWHVTLTEDKIEKVQPVPYVVFRDMVSRGDVFVLEVPYGPMSEIACHCDQCAVHHHGLESGKDVIE